MPIKDRKGKMKFKIQDIKDWLLKNSKWLILFICIIAFLAIAESVWNKEIIVIDIIGYKVISNLLISDLVTPIAKIITNFGGAICLSLIAIISLITIKNKKIGISVCLNLIIATALNILLKNILQRPRPIEFRLINETGYSFPSGHSMISMAFYGFIIYLIYKYVKNKKIKYTLITVLSILIFSIGISRIYLGVHYTSDVLGGFLISISYLIIYTRLVKRFVLEK